MSNNIFDDDSDHTQIYPMPGGKRDEMLRMLQNEQRQQRPVREPQPSPEPQYTRVVPPAPHTTGLPESDSLTDAASGLLILIAHISNTLDARDTNYLKQQMTEEIRHFSRQTKRLGISDATSREAAYILCTALDEAVLNTPWGRQSNWSKNTLLSTHFQDVSGGQVFFEKLRELGEAPARNLQVLKLMYYCLALGFQGRYRHENNSSTKLNQLRQWLGERIRSCANLDSSQELSPHWKGIAGLGFSLRDAIPAWLVGAVTAALLVGIFTAFWFSLSSSASDIIARLQGLNLKTASAAPVEPFQPKPDKPKLSEVMTDLEIDESDPNRTEVRLGGDTLFASGSVAVKESFQSTLSKLADELNIRPGQIRVTGHTDSVPVKKLKYPSNMELSQARAESVADIIKQKLDDPSRITTLGKGSTEPVVTPEKTPQDRAKNRRVTIDILN